MSDHLVGVAPTTRAGMATIDSRGTGWRGVCTCGWKGPERPHPIRRVPAQEGSRALAQADAVAHQNEAGR